MARTSAAHRRSGTSCSVPQQRGDRSGSRVIGERPLQRRRCVPGPPRDEHAQLGNSIEHRVGGGDEVDLALLVLLAADSEHDPGGLRDTQALSDALTSRGAPCPEDLSGAASFDHRDALRRDVQCPNVRVGNPARDGVKVIDEACRSGIGCLYRTQLPHGYVTELDPRRFVRCVDEARHDDRAGAPSSHPAHHVRGEQRAVEDIRRGRADATTQLAHAADVTLTAKRSDVETVGPDPLLVTETRVVHSGDGDLVAPLTQDGQQRRRRVLGSAHAEAVDDEEQLQSRSPSCHATCRATPSARVTTGFHASISAASDTSPPVRATSPA